jgi:hypothetical protein
MAIVHNIGYSTDITVVPAQVRSVSSLTVQYYFEDPPMRTLRAKFVELPVEIILWEGDAYDAIAADWTDADVLARLQELYPNS